MAQAGFAYEGMDNAANGAGIEPARLPLAVSIFADRAHLRDQMREDALGAGLRVGRCGTAEDLLSDEAVPLGELVLLDCPQVGAATLAALSRLDMRVARSSAQLIVSTSVNALDDVFACLDQSQAQLLVDPSHADRMVALGHALSRAGQASVKELSEEDRLTLLRITEQVDHIARRLNRFDMDGAGDAPKPSGHSELPVPGDHKGAARGQAKELGHSTRMTRPALPDPRLVRRIIHQRQLRGRFFDAALFADPAWDMLLDLAAARAEHTRVSVTSLCIASGVPPTTALRWIGQMTEAGLFRRLEDDTDRRRAFIALTDKAADAMAAYFAVLGCDAVSVV